MGDRDPRTITAVEFRTANDRVRTFLQRHSGGNPSELEADQAKKSVVIVIGKLYNICYEI